jgi:hypothetical protein
MLKLAQKGAIPKLWKTRRQGPTLQKGASQQLIEKCRGARQGRNGPGPVGPGWPGLAGLGCSELGSQHPLT